MGKRRKKRGSILTGSIGALLGALVGAALWAGVSIAGYMASIVGFVIAFLAGKGYDLFKGRKGKIKAIVLIVCVVLAVAIGNAGSYAFMIHEVYHELLAELPEEELQYALTEGEFYALMVQDSEVVGEFIKDFVVGLVFAALGCFTEIRNAGSVMKLRNAQEKEKLEKAAENTGE